MIHESRHMMNDLTINPFADNHAADVSDWPLNNDEATAWAGSNTPFLISRTQILRWNADPDVFVFVGYLSDELVAYGELWIDVPEQEIEIARVIVRPTHRGIGNGRTFVDLLAEKATDFGLKNTMIRVASENAAAVRCYKSAGFATVWPLEQETYNQGQPRKYVWLIQSNRSRELSLLDNAKDEPR